MRKTEAIHPGVDLQMTRQLDAMLRRGCLQRPACARCRDRGREAVLEHAIEIADAERTEDQNLGRHAGLAEDDRLFDVGARENRGAGVLQRERDRRRTMAVRVGLDDADDAGSLRSGSSRTPPSTNALIARKLDCRAARSTWANVHRTLTDDVRDFRSAFRIS